MIMSAASIPLGLYIDEDISCVWCSIAVFANASVSISPLEASNEVIEFDISVMLLCIS